MPIRPIANSIEHFVEFFGQSLRVARPRNGHAGRKQTDVEQSIEHLAVERKPPFGPAHRRTTAEIGATRRETR